MKMPSLRPCAAGHAVAAREVMARARALGDTSKDDAARAFIEAQTAAMHCFAGEWPLVLEQAPITRRACCCPFERLSQTWPAFCFLKRPRSSIWGG